MTKGRSALRWLPLALLTTLALAFEPIRSGFRFENQDCTFVPTEPQLRATFLNLRHVIGFAAITAATLWPAGRLQVVGVMVAVFVFSIGIEAYQSLFPTGHCRAWDLIPNVMGIALGTVLFLAVARRPGGGADR